MIIFVLVLFNCFCILKAADRVYQISIPLLQPVGFLSATSDDLWHEGCWQQLLRSHSAAVAPSGDTYNDDNSCDIPSGMEDLPRVQLFFSRDALEKR
ncbi:unnamed protein product [Victoria cruziana]